MKLTIEIFTEFVCLALTAAYTNPIDCLINYIALAVIAQLDEVVYNALERNLLKE